MSDADTPQTKVEAGHGNTDTMNQEPTQTPAKPSPPPQSSHNPNNFNGADGNEDNRSYHYNIKHDPDASADVRMNHNNSNNTADPPDNEGQQQQG